MRELLDCLLNLVLRRGGSREMISAYKILAAVTNGTSIHEPSVTCTFHTLSGR